MKKIIFGLSSFTLLISNVGIAGTMGPIQEAANWSGIYLGGEIGGTWLNQKLTETTAFSPPFTGHSSLTEGAFLGGGYIGYNFQKGPWILGVEGNVDGTALNNTSNCLVENSGAGNSNPGSCFPGAYSSTTKMPWEAAVRGRLGWVWNESLLYVAGGAAWANFKSTYTTPVGSIYTPSGSQSFSNTLTGGTIGAGVEYKPTQHWIGRAEYRYVNYGATSDYLTHGGGFWNGYTNKKAFYENMFHIGVSYLFN